MNFELYLIGLPLVAAVIGYSTNWIAIRMLFRPIEEKRVFGYRIPFTPGLIPKRRGEIAENIGQAVGEHLLTPEAIEARLRSEDVQNNLQKSLEDWITGFLKKERGTIKDELPGEAGQAVVDEVFDRLAGYLGNWTERVIRGEEFEGLMREFIEAALDDISEVSLGEIVDRWSYEEIRLKLEELLAEVSQGDGVSKAVTVFWLDKIEEVSHSEATVEDYMGEDLTEAVLTQVRRYLPFLLKKGGELLDSPKLKGRIEELIVETVDDKLQGEFEEDSVWDQIKLGFLETVVLPREKIRSSVASVVEEGIPKLQELLDREDFREELADSAVRTMRKALGKELSELKWTDRTKQGTAELLSELSVSLIENDYFQDLVLESLMITLKQSERKKVGELVEMEGEEEREALVRAITGTVMESLRSDRVQTEIVELIERKLSELKEKEIGRLSKWVEPESLTGFAEPAVSELTKLIAREGSGFLHTLDVSKLVRDEVEKFSTVKVEELVLDVTGDQFRAITWFGALIGLVVGLLQIGIIVLGG